MPHSHKLKTLPGGIERLGQVAERLEIASVRLVESIELASFYPDTSSEAYQAWNEKQSQLWYSADRIRDHVAELRRVLRRVDRLSTKPPANAGPLSSTF